MKVGVTMNQKTRASRVLCIGLLVAAFLSLPIPVEGGALTLATAPLANSTNTTVLPNLLFILDDSGSMGWNYLPDSANSRPSNISSTDFSSLQDNAAFNGVYYNPAIRYDPPVYYDSDGTLDTTTYPSQTGTSSATGANTSYSTPNWRSVANDGYGVQSTGHTNLESGASFYTFVAGEYCTTPDLTSCVAQSAASTTYPYSGALRWCSTTSLTTCQRTRDTTYKYVRYAGQLLSGSAATATFTISNIRNTNVISSIQVSGQEILSGSVSYNGSTERNLADEVVTAINACTTAAVGNCGVAGFSAARSGWGGSVNVVITAPLSMGNLTVTPTYARSGSGSGSFSISSFGGGSAVTTVPGSNVMTTITSSVSSYPYPGSTAKATARTDCAGTTCTYAEEMTNYANWWAYYHTRMQTMKTAVSRAFRNVDNRYRVGYTTISYTGGTDGSRFQHIDKFELAQKNTWYNKLFAADPSSSTPLRGALSKAGMIFAHKLSGADDPVQYSCQQNFTILSTDGYWNTGSETSSYGPKALDGSDVGDQDGTGTDRPMYEGATASSNSLADVAKYYYDTDLRTSALGNCSGAISGVDVCDNNVFVSSTDNNVKQHMTTFTIGLGVDGELDYSSDYTTIRKDTASVHYPAPVNGSLDYYNLINGYGSPVVDWPYPVADTVTAIDDLWHAAVNGRGVYFSAKDPDAIYDGFTEALASIQARLGAGAAAATSTLNPVSGDNSAFVASYTTVKWTGNLESRSIDTVTGAVSQSAIWCAEDVVASDTGATTCSGTMAAKVGASSDTRTIYMKVGAGLAPFNYSNISSVGLNSYFDSGFLSSHLSQWATLTAAEQSIAGGDNLVNFLRGQYGYDDRSSNTDKLYRLREAVLGDATESRPAYVGGPTFNYGDPGYSAFKSAHASRSGTVYIGTNDGMLHAFDATSGVERWAFVPTGVIPNLWKLADKNYATMHTNYVNGAPEAFDICVSSCSSSSATWKTILVGGLNGGGRDYYALDITDPTLPSLLWEFRDSDDADLGYTFGNPIVTKKADGTWVVLVTSGYDNGTISGDGSTANAIAGDGKGYLYVLNAATGAVISKIGTGAGTAADPSGLSKIAAWADNSMTDNTALYVYGGDLQGNLWRFDINALSVMKFATLMAGASAQPITVQPELGSVNGKRVVFVGTGKYLEVSDLSTTQQQTIYAILDDNATTTLNDPRSSLVAQTLTTVGATRTATNNAVDFTTGRGWYVDLPDVGERQNVDGRLESGTLLVPTTVPENSVCSPGGYSWMNFFNYLNGGPVDTTTNEVSSKTNAPIVGINVYYIDGRPVVSQVTADDPTPDVNDHVQFRNQASSFQRKKVIWRELMP